MKTLLVIVPLALALTAAARAQSSEPTAAVSTPTTPAPAVSSPSPAPTRIIYVPRLPSANELSAAAAAQNMPIVRIEISSTEVTAVYQAAGAPATAVAYRLLQPATTEAPPTVVYRPAPAAVYYEDYGPAYYYGYPGYYVFPHVRPGVSLRFGFGGHHYRGGHGHRGR